jgi:hypothetical protein
MNRKDQDTGSTSLDLSLGVSRQLRHYETLKDNDSVSFILIIPGTDVSLNC